jgi:peptidoglycan/LPS O-acetylase OafA/YrhL
MVTRAALIWKVVGLVTLSALLVSLPKFLVLLGVIWVAGAFAALFAQRRALMPLLTHPVVRATGLIALLSTMPLARALPDFFGDFELGIVVAAVLPILATMPSLGHPYRAVTLGASKVSYTLYLTHFPLLALIAAVYLTPERMPSSMLAFVAFILVCLAASSWAWLIWWCFERHTDQVYSLIARMAPER